MNKAELVESVQKSLGADTSKAAAERAVAAVIEGIEKGLKKDKSVQLIGFGTFSVAKRAAREGINPQTKEKIKIKASKTVKFKVGAGLVRNPIFGRVAQLVRVLARHARGHRFESCHAHHLLLIFLV